MACARVSVMALLAALPFSQASAEFILDGTMGPAGPLSGPDFSIADTLGTTQGANLFHSFSVFNIDSSESATFTGPAGSDNVISRVTGGAPSSIDGLFRSTSPSADVYFINPSGILFDENASLDVQGAFHASTASYLRLEDGGIFHATDPSQTVLTSAETCNSCGGQVKIIAGIEDPVVIEKILTHIERNVSSGVESAYRPPAHPGRADR